MIDGPSRLYDARGHSRRAVLATGAVFASASLAGCLGGVLDSSSGYQEIEPETPSDPRAGTPGEFYSLVEKNDIEVASLTTDETDLFFHYYSDAETEEKSITEIEIIATVYNENLVRNDAGFEMLYAEIENPFDGQALGWGVRTEWCERYNRVVDEAEEDGTSEEESIDDESVEPSGTDDESTADGDGNETAGDDEEVAFDEMDDVMQAQVLLVNNVLNSRVYEDDL